MHNFTLTELACHLRTKAFSSVELTQALHARAAGLGRELNAFISLDLDKSLAQARAADQLLARGEGGPLTGIPLAHKDLFCANGWRTTCGSRMLADFVAPYDAHVIEQCQRAGAVILGKTNMDEFAMGSSNENSCFGPVKNPWDTTRVPGGSSGGSAAAVAARIVPAATGSDTGGSVRQPAAFTGVCGIKPTYGRVSRWGMVAYASSLDQGGALARSAGDLGQLLNAIAGFDPRDSTSLDEPPEDFTRDLDRPLAGLTIGLPREYFTEALDNTIATPILAALDELKRLGAKTVEVTLPNQHLAIPAYYVIACAEASSNLARYDGVRYGHRAAGASGLAELYEMSRAEGFGAEVKRRILVGTYVLSHGYYDAYYLHAQKLRRLIAQDFARALETCDVIAGPAAPSVAFALGSKTTDPVQMYLQDLYTITANLAGLPALAIPCGFAAHLPVGLQFIGRHRAEAKLLNVAHQYQQATDWHQQAPS